MRTLKKALSLVLVLAMVFALAVPGFAADTTKKASDFKDYSKVTNKEAVDVLTAIGVINGNADGTFAPEGNFTRAEAATMITYLTLGKTVADALPTGATQFTDVPATHWAAKYVQYCAQEGIVAGVGNGKFDPDAKLTATQWALMLLGALGYKAANEGIAGTGWEIATTKLAMKAGIATADELTATFNRDMAAKLALNTLTATEVEYTGGSTVTVNGVTFTNGAVRSEVTVEKDTATIAGTKDAKGTVQFAEQHFPKLVLTATNTTADVLKHPANLWKNNNKEIGTYAKEADVTIIAHKAYNGVVDAYKDINDKNYTGTSVATKFVNGNTWDGKVKIGDVIELYMTDGVITTAIGTRYSVGKITDVSTSLTKAQKEAGATCKVQIADGSYYLNTAIEGFDADTYVKGAYVLYVTGTKAVVASEIAKSVTGEVTATKNDEVSINGTFYTDTTSANIGDKGTFYLGKADQVVAKDTSATASDNYAYIYNVSVATKANADGDDVETVTVYYVTVDGTKASAAAKTEKDGSHNIYLDDGKAGETAALKIATWNTSSNKYDVVKGVVAFNLNSDKQFVYAPAKDGIATADNVIVNKTSPVVATVDTNKSVSATNDTKFVFVNKDSKNVYKTNVVTGYKSVNITSNTNVYTVYNTNKQAVYCFVAADNGSVTTSANLAVLLSKTPTVTLNADKAQVFTYDVAVNGEVKTLTFKTAAFADKADGTVFAYEMDGEYAVLDTSVNSTGFLATNKTIKAAGADYFVDSANTYVGTSSAKVYTITIEFKDEAAYNNFATSKTAQAVTVSEGATLKTGATVYYTTSADNVANNVFVVSYVY